MGMSLHKIVLSLMLNSKNGQNKCFTKHKSPGHFILLPAFDREHLECVAMDLPSKVRSPAICRCVREIGGEREGSLLCWHNLAVPPN